MSFKYTCTWFYGLNTAFEVESASTGLHRRHTIAPPFLYRHSPGATVPNRSSTGMSRGYVGSPPWHTVAKPGVTVSPPWTQLMPVLLRLHPVAIRWREGRSTVMPRNNSVLFRTSVRPDCFKTTGATSRWSPVEHCLSRFNARCFFVCLLALRKILTFPKLQRTAFAIDMKVHVYTIDHISLNII